MQKHETYAKDLPARDQKATLLDTIPLTIATLNHNPALRPETKICIQLNETGYALQASLAEDELDLHYSLARVLNQVSALVEAVALNPELQITHMPLLSQADKQQIIVDWNQTTADFSKSKTLQQLFEAQVAKTPERIAVVFEGKSLTYKKLNEKANQLAHYLRQQGVKADSLVTISMERSLEMVIGLFGILKAGGAYVPLDPSYPEDRLQFMLEDTQSSLLLSQTHLQGLFSEYTGQFMALDNLDFQAYPASNPSLMTELAI